MEFPHTAVICTPTEEDAKALFEIFVTYDFYDNANGEEPFIEFSDMDWKNPDTCYDIEDKGVYSADRHYYETRFKTEYPDLVPEDPKWFLCTVQDFIAMCEDEATKGEFDIAGEGDLEAMLRG